MAALNMPELKRCLPGLQRYSVSLTRSHDQAADLVQDCVERALRKAHLFDGANLQAWLTTLCRRVYLNSLRKAKTRGQTVEIDASSAHQLAVNPVQEDHLVYLDVVREFQLLAPCDQKILTVVGLEGNRYCDAAQMLQVPVGTVRSRLSRARARLAARIEAGTAIPSASRHSVFVSAR